VTPPGWKFLERVRLVAPLGVRFWDRVTGAVVSEGLEVEVFPEGHPEQRVTVAANNSGVFNARGLPGLAGFETGGVANPTPRAFVIEVTDRAGRFLPFALPVDVPAGLLQWEPGVTMVPLFSAPSRPVPAGMAVVRAQLVRADVPGPDPLDPEKRWPAPWAVLEVTPPGGPAVRGLADEGGSVVVVCPYPEPPPPPVDRPSPPPDPIRPGDRTWAVGVKAFFAPPASPLAATTDRPDLRALMTQPAARAWADTALATELTAATLLFGQEMVLRTTVPGTSPPESKPELFITTP